MHKGKKKLVYLRKDNGKILLTEQYTTGKINVLIRSCSYHGLFVRIRFIAVFIGCFITKSAVHTCGSGGNSAEVKQIAD